MENTRQNALNFLFNADDEIKMSYIHHPMLSEEWDIFADHMVNYVAYLRPATVSEEDKSMILSLIVYFQIEDEGSIAEPAIKWLQSLLKREQTRIVLPDEFHSNPVSPYRDGWNACIESIRSLNPSATFVTAQNEGR